MFEKFNRLEDAWFSNTGGAGLSLSIAEEIIHLWWKDYCIQSKRNHRLCDYITFRLGNKNVILEIT